MKILSIQSNFKFIAIIVLVVFVFSFSLTRAEEQSAPMGETSMTADIGDDAAGNTEVQGVPAVSNLDEQSDAANKENNISQDNSSVPSQTTTQESNQESAPGQSAPAVAASSDNSGPTPAPADTEHNIITGISRRLTINNLSIIAQWQMSAVKQNGGYIGEDSRADSGAQFLPSGQYQVDKPIAVCALVADKGGADGIDSVSAEINYPKDIAIGEPAGTTGCGQSKSQVSLKKLSSDEAAALVCDQIRNNNNNLLAWDNSQAENIAYSFEQVCGQDGYLEKLTAAVYCGETPLAYDDPAGDYQVKTTVQNSSGLSNVSDNSFRYLELTTFENDFSDIQYGPVKENDLKILKGDTVWGVGTLPTVRNIGNTRLRIKIKQNDFGLGKTNGAWNIAYQSKVGSDTDFVNYTPEQITVLNNPLDLGETANMDFGATISRFPDANDQAAYWGSMTLTADKAPYSNCQ